MRWQTATLAGTRPIVTIDRPRTTTDLDDVRDLMRAFVAWHREHHEEDRDLVDGYFDDDAFEQELASLADYYAPLEGDLLLARCDGEAAGCVALRRLDESACEMKRMFLYPRFQGLGLGRALGEEIIRRAKDAGFAVMRLDTSIRQQPAQALYRSLGFEVIGPYYELPQELQDWLVFMERRL